MNSLLTSRRSNQRVLFGGASPSFAPGRQQWRFAPLSGLSAPSVPRSGDAARTSACATRTALRWPIRRPRMVLSDVDIKRYIEAGKIKIAPDLPPEQFGRNLDLPSFNVALDVYIRQN